MRGLSFCFVVQRRYILSKKEQYNWGWPSITDRASAKKAGLQGCVAALICTGMAALTIVTKLFDADTTGHDWWAYSNLLLFVLITVGVYKMNRLAVIVSPLLYAAGRIIMLVNGDGFGSPVLAAAFLFLFVNSIRGVFGFHKYAKERA